MKFQEILFADTANGPGFRVSIWVSGCDIHCPGCFNLSAQDPTYGCDFTENTINEIITHLDRDEIKGLSILGGEPTFIPNRSAVTDLVRRVKSHFGDKKTIWLWTGHLFEQVKDLEMMKYIDVCVDGPFIEAQKDLRLQYAGSTNQRVIDVQKSLKEKEIVKYKEN